VGKKWVIQAAKMTAENHDLTAALPRLERICVFFKFGTLNHHLVGGFSPVEKY